MFFYSNNIFVALLCISAHPSATRSSNICSNIITIIVYVKAYYVLIRTFLLLAIHRLFFDVELQYILYFISMNIYISSTCCHRAWYLIILIIIIITWMYRYIDASVVNMISYMAAGPYPFIVWIRHASTHTHTNTYPFTPKNRCLAHTQGVYIRNGGDTNKFSATLM